jgi:hypothetical protein
VLYSKDNVAIVEGLNNDADVGTVLAFSSGARGWVCLFPLRRLP